MLKRTLGLVGLLVVGCAEPAESTRQETTLTTTKCVTFERGHGKAEVADAFIKPNALRRNFGDKPVLRVSSSDEALLRFELESIPRSATVTKATLKLFANGEAGDGTLLLHRITTPWREDEVTYGSFKQGFAPGPVGAMRLESKKARKSVDVTQVVAGWVLGTTENQGFELEVGSDHQPRRERDCDDDHAPTLFVSSEGAAGKRPALEVCYSVFIDECAENPCRNGGSCSNGTDGFTCDCRPGFGGPTCEELLDRCAESPCQHGGTCASDDDGYTCLCPAGYGGANCEGNIDDCAAAPCQNGGVCTDGVAGFTCACASGYDGASCEHAIDDCEGEPCHNGGSCSSNAGGFSCACPEGYSGPTCDTNIDDCADSPCVNGTCVDGIAGYGCSCSPDWGGEHCDVNLNRCAQAPCLNGGSCTNGQGTYACSCAAGYGGVNCELDLDDCVPNPCQNGSVCVDGVAGHSCLCPAGYEGDACETPVVPPVQVRIDGLCVPICTDDVDPDGNGWGREHGAACLMPTNPLASTAPWCETPVSAEAYEAPSATIDGSTTSVATIPRPARVDVGAPSDCPHDAAGLVPLNPSWLHDGMLHIPVSTRALVRGNREIAASTLVRMLHIPASSELVFADEPATFRVTDVMVEGALRLGGPTCRLQSSITFEFDTDEDVGSAAVREAIVNRMGLGIMVGEKGVLEMFGRLYQPTWTRLAATAEAGASMLSLADAVDWEPGQQLVVATSGHVDYPLADENELRTITAVGGTTVTVDRPLSYRHYGGPEYQVEVGLLSRSLRFRTADRVATAAPTFGGHIMVHSKNGRVSGVELHGLGQQNFLGRYPFHFHRAGDVAGGSYFTDSSVWRSNWRCAVVHRTDRALVSRNVAYDNFGHCYYFEDGVELNNELSFNLAVRTKIMGPIDQASIEAMRWQGQEGFTLVQSADMTQPADRAAAGFYISNGNNRIIGNATSGGFAGYSLPNLPRAIGGSPERIYPIAYGVSDFDGNTAHSVGYLWAEGGAGVYVGGTLTEENGLLKYASGRSTEWGLLRHQTEVFNNTKTFLCETGIVHWGNQPRIVNFEAWNNGLLAKLFGSASIQSSLAVGRTAHVLPPRYYGAYDTSRPLSYWRRGFQFYDTRTQTILSDVIFRGFRRTDGYHCALSSMTHSDQFTPQRMNAVAGLHFADVDDALRLCVNDAGTLSSRNFNVIDSDGSLSGTLGDGLPPGPRLVASAYADAWRLSSQCVEHAPWGAVVCPLETPHNVASVGTVPNADVRVTTYGLENTTFGETWYSSTEHIDAQITAPSGIGWHHSFPGGVPESVQVQVLQVPDESFVLFSLTLAPGVACSIAGSAWTEVPTVDALLESTGAAYTTAQGTCFVRIPPTAIGAFEAAGLSVPNMTWRGNPTPTTYFTIDTGCTSGSAACRSVVSQVPTL